MLQILLQSINTSNLCVSGNWSGKLLVGQSRSIQSNNMTNKENDTDAVKSSKCIGDAKIDVTLGIDSNCGDMYFFY